MSLGLALANIDRAAGHAVLLGIVVLVAAVYGLVRLVVKHRAGRTRSDRDRSDRGSEHDRDTGA